LAIYDPRERIHKLHPSGYRRMDDLCPIDGAHVLRSLSIIHQHLDHQEQRCTITKFYFMPTPDREDDLDRRYFPKSTMVMNFDLYVRGFPYDVMVLNDYLTARQVR